ncbi:MAG TPA: dTMP kinase [Rhodothermia bacterium]
MLFTFEGIDGSGKSSQISLLEARLRASGRKVLALREPGGTEISERVREILLDKDLAIAPVAEMLLFSAARAQLVVERIRPALDTGHVVLCDRFYDSTTAYQGAGRGIADTEWIISLHRIVTAGLIPDRTYWIDISPETAQRRMSGMLRDRMEIENGDFYDRVAACYRALAKEEPDRFLRIDGETSLEEVQVAIWSDVQTKLAAKADERSEPSFQAKG